MSYLLIIRKKLPKTQWGFCLSFQVSLIPLGNFLGSTVIKTAQYGGPLPHCGVKRLI